MDFSIANTTLAAALSALRNVAHTDPTTILSGVLIEADDADGITFRANDTHIMGTRSVAAQVRQPGRAVVTLSDLLAIVKRLPQGGTVQLKLSGDRLDLNTERSQYNFSTHDPQAFPEWTNEAPRAADAVPARDIARIIETVIHALDPDNATPSLTGILLTTHGGQTDLRAVATDGSRLAMRRCQAPIQLPPDGIVIHQRTAREIVRLCAEYDTVRLSANTATLRIEARDESTDDPRSEVLVSKLVDAAYPDYRIVLDRWGQHEIVVRRKELQAAVERVAEILDKKTGITLEVKPQEVWILASRNDRNAREIIDLVDRRDAEGWQEDAGHFRMNARFLLDSIKAMKSESVVLRYDGAAPIGFDGENDPGMVQVLMPMGG